MPIFWTDDELDMLTGSYLLQQIDERILAIEKDYASICDVAPSFREVCTVQEFSWARMCVCSRNFGLIVNGLRTAALVPYADMLNHYRPRETKWQFDDSRQGFTVVSLCEISSGAQVYDSYGQKCNHRFLLNYGFSIENNVEEDGLCPNEVCSNISQILVEYYYVSPWILYICH
jgi:histone-lysine N-methyltransferase SETD3